MVLNAQTSIDDVNAPGVIRMAFRSVNNLDFPAHSPDSLLEAMEMGDDFVYNETDTLGTGEVRIPRRVQCDWGSLARKATENPVSVAIHYKKIIYDLMTILVGIKPGTTSGNNKRTVKTEYRGWGEETLGVINGTPAAFTGVTETTARASLHFHVGKITAVLF